MGGALARSPSPRPNLSEPRQSRRGTKVRVKPGYRKPEFAGMLGVVSERWGGPDYAAFDVWLADGRRQLFWFHELEKVDEAVGD